MEVNKEKIRYILQFFFDKDENVNQTAEILNGVYDADTVTTSFVQFWFHRFRSGIFDVNPLSGYLPPKKLFRKRFTLILLLPSKMQQTSILFQFKNLGGRMGTIL
ncbi:hypothetical protein TNCV_3515651 [Trichonephila clavipes]|nr:hypothetical protein TNCV_3515651 [Trichonephila clavipes]